MFKKAKAPTAGKKLHRLWRSLYLSIMLMLVVNMSYLGVFFVVKETGVNVGGIINEAVATASWPNCGWGCQANDFTLTKAWLADCSDSTKMLNSECAVGTSVSTCIWGEFDNNTSRKAVTLLADILINGLNSSKIDNCVADSVAAGTPVEKLHSLNWTCGDEIKLDNITVAWATNNNATCASSHDGTCKDYNTAQCDNAGDAIMVAAPLIASFTYNAPTCGLSAVSFDGKATGGEGTASFSWNFGDGDSSTDENPSHTYTTSGSYTVVLTVTKGTITDTETKIVTVNANGTEACPVYTWSTGEWSTCSKTCGDETQNRTVNCLKNGITPVAESYCAGTAPAASQSCNLGACPICSDGAVNHSTETCDDGNLVDHDGCSATCQWETKTFSCGDLPLVNSVWNSVSSFFQTCTASNGTSCTNWSPVDGTMPSYSLTPSTVDCFYKCDNGYGLYNGECVLLNSCGNGIPEEGETCEDGNITNGDGCDSSCQWESKKFDCAAKPSNSVWNSVSSYYLICTASADGACTAWSPTSTDTTYNITASNNSCHFVCETNYSWDGKSCVRDPYCGDKVKNLEEQCDGTSGVGEHQTCSDKCILEDLPYCGNETVEGEEQCDSNEIANGSCGVETCQISCDEGYHNANGSCASDDAPVIYAWVTGDYGSCSATCGDGTQSRTVACKGSDGSTDESGESCKEEKPVASQTCNTQSCGGGGGGGGGGGYISFAITNPQVTMQCVNGKVDMTLTWLTTYPADSRVVYDTTSKAGSSIGTAPNYGYAKSTALSGTQVTGHSVAINGLGPNTYYYFRPISNYNFSEVIGEEKPLTQTLSCAPGEDNQVIVLGEEGAPELVLTNKALSPVANPGAKGVEYEITVTNNGDLPSFNTVLTNVLPEGFTYTDFGGNEWTWALGDLNPGESKKVVVKVDIAPGVSVNNYVSNASVSSDNHDAVTAAANIEVKKVVVLAETGFSTVEFLTLLALLSAFAGTSLFLRKKVAVKA